MEIITLQIHMSRRGLLLFVPLLAALMALVLWGFLLTEAPASAADEPAGSRLLDTDTLKVGIGGLPADFDPAVNVTLDKLIVLRQVYDTLTNYDTPAAQVVPQLAESWSVSQDGMTWTFDLRTGVTFQDGTPLDADAVVYNFERWWDPAHSQHDGNFDFFEILFGGFKGSEETLLAGISATSEYQVELQLTRPSSLVPYLLTSPAFSIASPDALQGGVLSSMPVGSAAYTYVSTDTNVMHLSAYAGYWGSGPQIPNLDFVLIEDPVARMLSLQAGEIQVAERMDDEALAVALDPNFQIIWREAIGSGYLGMNRGHSPLDVDEVRQAIAHAINLPALLAGYYSYGDEVATQLVPPAAWGYNPSLSGYSYDPALASDLLTTAGYGGGFTTTLSYRDVSRSYLPDPAAAASAIQADLLTVGISVTVQELEPTDFINQYFAGDLDLFLLGWYADFPHADSFYSILCSGSAAGYGPRDDAFCDSLEAAQGEFNPLQQLNLYYALAQEVHDDLPLLPIVHPREAVVLHASLAGFVPSLMGIEEFKDTYYAGATQVVVSTESPTTLTYTDPQGSPTTVEVPAGSVSETVLLRLEPGTAGSLPQGKGSAGHDFDLSAIQDGETLEGFSFSQQVGVTIEYSDADVQFLDESTLGLYIFDGDEWVPAEQTCTPSGEVVLDLGANSLSTGICHLSSFAVLAERYTLLFLPSIGR